MTTHVQLLARGHYGSTHAHRSGLVDAIVHAAIWRATGRAVDTLFRSVPGLTALAVAVVIVAFVVYAARRRRVAR